MLTEVSVVDQRYEAVMDVLRGGESVVDVAARLGVSRQSVHTWLRNYASGGVDGLKDRSRRPHTCPHQMPAIVEARVLELRRLHPGWGPRRIVHQLGRDGFEQLPSTSSVYRCLLRRALIAPRSKKRRRDDYVRWERDRAMELWQMDVMGGVLLSDGTDLKVVTAIDDHSRFCMAATIITRATSRAVSGVFARALQEFGAPDEVLTDNGKVFTGHYGINPHETLFDRLCRDNGIRHLLTGVRSPTTTGKIERFHRTLRTEHLRGRVFADLGSAQHELDDWVGIYNTERPHQGLGMLTPSERFAGSRATAADVLPPDTQAMNIDRSGDGWVSRRVASNGIISVAWQEVNVGKHHGGEHVDVHVGNELLEVWSGNDLIKSAVRTFQGEVRKKNAEGTRSRGVGMRLATAKRQASTEDVSSSVR